MIVATFVLNEMDAGHDFLSPLVMNSVARNVDHGDIVTKHLCCLNDFGVLFSKKTS